MKSWLHEHGAQREHWLIRKISGAKKEIEIDLKVQNTKTKKDEQNVPSSYSFEDDRS